MSRMTERLRREISVLRAVVGLRRSRVQFGPRPTFEHFAPVIKNSGSMLIGPRVRFLGAESRSFIRAHSGATLSVGARALVNSEVVIDVHESIEIGDDVKIGSNVSISDSSAHELVRGQGIHTAAVRVGDNVWIGRGAFIAPGVTIGTNSIVGAGAFVKHDVAPDTVVAGVPARPIRTLPPSVGPRH